MIFECWDSSGTGLNSAIDAGSHAEAAARFVAKLRGKVGKAALVFVVNNAAQDYQVFYADELDAAQSRTAPPPEPEQKPASGKGGFLRVVK